MLRFVLLAGILILSGCEPEPEPAQALTACEEHYYARFRAPRIDTTMTRNPSEFDVAPSEARLHFYLEGWETAVKRTVVGVGTQLTFWEYNWSETDDYCLYHRVFSKLKMGTRTNYPIEEIAKNYFEDYVTIINNKKILSISNKNYETISLIYFRDNKNNYCTIFQIFWEEKHSATSLSSINGALCTSKNRPMPPNALETILTNITHLLGPSDPPLDIGTMPIPQ